MRLFISTLLVKNSAFFALVIQNLEEIESLKNEKKSWNSSGKVLEFCFPISVRTLIEIFDLHSLIVKSVLIAAYWVFSHKPWHPEYR